MDCLVTKLKASVSDATLPKLGEFSFPISAGDTAAMGLIGAVIDVIGEATGTVDSIGDITFPYTMGTKRLVITAVQDCTVVVKQKYSITKATYLNANIYLSDLFYSPITELQAYRLQNCNINDVNRFSTCTKISLAPSGNSAPKFLEGSLDVLFPNGNTTLTQLTINRSKCTGALANLGRLTHLTSLELLNNTSLIDITPNDGKADIDTVFDAMVTNGRVSGTMTVKFNSGIYSSSGVGSNSTITFTSDGWSATAPE